MQPSIRRDPQPEAPPSHAADRITHITRPVFNAIAQIANADEGATAAPETIHQQLKSFIERARHDAANYGLAPHDVDDIIYALVALADEQVLMRGGPLRDFWLPRLLQLHYFNENIAGDNFFRRMGALIGAPGRDGALKVYYLCLLFGFQGRYRIRGGGAELEGLIEQANAALRRSGAIMPEVNLSPSGKRPYEAIADARRNMLVLWLSGVAAAASVVWYLWLRLDVAAQAGDLVERISALSGG